MSYAMSAIEAEQAGAKQLGASGGGKLNLATGIATFTRTPAPQGPVQAAKAAAKLDPVAQKYIARNDPRAMGIRPWIRANRATARRPGHYQAALKPRHEPAPRPAAVRRPNYDLLKTLQQTLTPQPKTAAPKEITLAVNQLPYKPLRRMAKMALTVSGYNLG